MVFPFAGDGVGYTAGVRDDEPKPLDYAPPPRKTGDSFRDWSAADWVTTLMACAAGLLVVSGLLLRPVCWLLGIPMRG
jgi:hypothetical protein